jgi:hypothetical protein
MHALAIEFDGMREWDLMPREKLRVAVTGGTGVGQILLGHTRNGIACSLNLMHWPVAGHAVRRVRITLRGRLSVYALAEFLHFIGMALRALCRRSLGCSRHLMGIAVAGLANLLA